MTAALQPETKTVALPDGRALAFVECGAPDGRPVFSFHGLPGSRMQRHPDESIARQSRRARDPRRSSGVWPLDAPTGPRARRLAARRGCAADRLGLERFAVAGTSGGGLYAAACAALLGSRVTRTAIVSGVGPAGSMTGGRMTPGARLGFLLGPRAAWAVRGAVAAIARFAVRAPSRYIDVLSSHMSPSDRPILARDEVRAMLAQDLREAFRAGHPCLRRGSRPARAALGPRLGSRRRARWRCGTARTTG